MSYEGFGIMFRLLPLALLKSVMPPATARYLQNPSCFLLDPTCDPDFDLFTSTYDRYRPPSLSEDAEGDPTVVYVQLFLNSVPNLCTASQRLSFTALVEYSWYDDRLNLSRVTKNRYTELPQHLLERIWKPTLSILPAALIRELDTTNNVQAHVTSDQKIVMNFRIYVSLFCKMDLFYYPFDVHICDMSIVNVGSDDHQSILRWIGDERSPYRVSEQSIYGSSWSESSVGSFRCSHILPLSTVDNIRGGRRRTRLIVRVRLQRRLEGPLMNIYVPSIITVVLSWAGFWQSPSKTNFRIIVTSFCFVLITFQQSAQTVFRHRHDYVVSTDVWYMTCYIFVLASLVEFIVIQKLEGWEKRAESSTNAPRRSDPGTKKQLVKMVSASEIDEACKTFFPLIFFFVTVAYAIGFGSHLLVAGDPTVITHQSSVLEEV